MPKPKRNVLAVAEETATPPDALPTTQHIARVVAAAGNNLYQLILPSGTQLLAELPARFRNTIWIKRGSYVLVDTAALADRDNKLGGTIENIVREEKRWRKMAYWPKEFPVENRIGGADDTSEEDSDPGPQMPPDEDSEDEK